MQHLQVSNHAGFYHKRCCIYKCKYSWKLGKQLILKLTYASNYYATLNIKVVSIHYEIMEIYMPWTAFHSHSHTNRRRWAFSSFSFFKISVKSYSNEQISITPNDAIKIQHKIHNSKRYTPPYLLWNGPWEATM